MSPERKQTNIHQKAMKYFRYPRFAIYAIIILYVLLTWMNIPFPLLNPPPATPTPYNWVLTYPSSPPNSLNFQDASTTMAFQMAVSANRPFADGVAIRVSALGSVGSALGENISSVTLGFLGAYPYGLNPAIYVGGSPLAGVFLEPTLMRPNGTVFFDLGGPYLIGNPDNIEFRSYGDFSLTIQIKFNNWSDPITYTYQDFKISLQSSESLRQGQINYSVGACAFGGFLFVVFDLLPKLTSNSREQDDSNTRQNPQTSPRSRKSARVQLCRKANY